jgi:hypothetical protein
MNLEELTSFIFIFYSDLIPEIENIYLKTNIMSLNYPISTHWRLLPPMCVLNHFF